LPMGIEADGFRAKAGAVKTSPSFSKTSNADFA